MNINVPIEARDHFWHETPEGSWDFWAFRFPPKCEVGDKLIFRFDKVPVATAIVAKIEKPGESKCERTGKWEHRYKIYWLPSTFVDLRDKGLIKATLAAKETQK